MGHQAKIIFVGKADKTALRAQAKFIGQQYMQMAVDANEEDLFDTTNDIEDLDVDTESDVDSLGSESEEGQISEESTDVPGPAVVNQRVLNASLSHPEQQKIDQIDQEIQQRILDLHDQMEESGLHGAVQLIEQLFNKPGQDKVVKGQLKSKLRKKTMGKADDNQNVNGNRSLDVQKLNIPVEKQSSKVTIYQNAVQKRNSSSSEDDGLDLSDESKILNHLVLDGNDRPGTSAEMDPPVPLQIATKQTTKELTPDDHAAHMVQLSEKAKANMFPPKGETNLNLDDGKFRFIAQMDQDCNIVGAHIDEMMQQKIEKGMYVDFSKLLPKDRILIEDDGRMELIVKDGKTFWMPASASEGVAITSFSKWEQAFGCFPTFI